MYNINLIKKHHIEIHLTRFGKVFLAHCVVVLSLAGCLMYNNMPRILFLILVLSMYYVNRPKLYFFIIMRLTCNYQGIY